jgi:hypothetical protein
VAQLRPGETLAVDWRELRRRRRVARRAVRRVTRERVAALILAVLGLALVIGLMQH